MTKQVFEQLIGREATEAEFNKANDIYLAAGSMTKQEVVADILDNPGLMRSPVVDEIVKTVNVAQRAHAVAQNKLDKMTATLLSAGELLAEDESIWAEIAELVGPAEVIRYKIEKGVMLLPQDTDYIKENLT